MCRHPCCLCQQASLPSPHCKVPAGGDETTQQQRLTATATTTTISKEDNHLVKIRQSQEKKDRIDMLMHCYAALTLHSLQTAACSNCE